MIGQQLSNGRIYAFAMILSFLFARLRLMRLVRNMATCGFLNPSRRYATKTDPDPQKFSTPNAKAKIKIPLIRSFDWSPFPTGKVDGK